LGYLAISKVFGAGKTSLHLLAAMLNKAVQERARRKALPVSKQTTQWTENKMNLLKKAAISLAATSMVVAPVAASAAPVAAAAVSSVDSQSELEGSSWIIGLLALAAVIGGIVLLSDNKDDKPVSK
jgi:hypothetical protein